MLNSLQVMPVWKRGADSSQMQLLWCCLKIEVLSVLKQDLSPWSVEINDLFLQEMIHSWFLGAHCTNLKGHIFEF